jgi:peptidyl-prolyl cis-trans isomerase SurA
MNSISFFKQVRPVALTVSALLSTLVQAQVTAPVARPAAASATAPKAAAPATAQGTAKVVDSIVAVVNDEVITNNELMSRIRTIEIRMRGQKVELPPLADFRRQVLERMIMERAQVQQARDQGLRVDDGNLDRSIARVAEANKMNTQQFRDQIEKEGFSYADYREEVRSELMLMRLREREVESKIVIADAEVDNFLAAEAITAATAQEFNLAQILIRIPENASSETIASRRAKAEEVMQKITAGDDFGKLAATFSDGSDALSGGELGWRSPDRLPQLFVDAVIKLQQGQVAPIVKSPNGYHILKVLGKRSLPQAAGAATPSTIQQTHARHILIKLNQLVTAADAKRKLLEVKERLANKAARFEDLAKSFSNDGSASKGGDLGWLYPGDTVPEFEKAMDSLEIGQISDPIESSFGYHLIEVLERKKDDLSQERKRQDARAALRARKLDEATDEYQRQLRDKAYVEMRLDAQ